MTALSDHKPLVKKYQRKQYLELLISRLLYSRFTSCNMWVYFGVWQGMIVTQACGGSLVLCPATRPTVPVQTESHAGSRLRDQTHERRSHRAPTEPCTHQATQPLPWSTATYTSPWQHITTATDRWVLQPMTSRAFALSRQLYAFSFNTFPTYTCSVCFLLFFSVLHDTVI